MRVRVSLAHSDPSIWRLLELDAALALDRVHDVIQIAFGWEDCHLHSFSSVNPYGARPKKGAVVIIPRRWFTQDLLDDGRWRAWWLWRQFPTRRRSRLPPWSPHAGRVSSCNDPALAVRGTLDKRRSRRRGVRRYCCGCRGQLKTPSPISRRSVRRTLRTVGGVVTPQVAVLAIQ